MSLEDIKEKNGLVEREQKYLFNLDLKKHEQNLRIGEMDDNLIEAIREEGYPLQKEAQIVEIFIGDSEENKKYWKVENEDEYLFLKSDGDKLEVYVCEGKSAPSEERKSSPPRFGGHKSRKCDGDCENCDLAYSFLC